MRVFTERRGEAVVLRPVGRFSGGPETKELESKLGALLSESNCCVVVDLSRASHLNSSAIGVLIGSHIRAADHRSEVRLCNADRSIHHTLVVLRLIDTMNVYDSLLQALADPFPRPQSMAERV